MLRPSYFVTLHHSDQSSAQERTMNVPSHSTEADFRDFHARLSRVEERLAAQLSEMAPAAPAPSSLPVDKMQLADYAQHIAPAVGDDEDDEAPVNPMGNLTQTQVREVVAAFDDYLRWKELPNPTMTQDMKVYIERDALRRLQEAMRPLEGVVKGIE